MPGALNPGRLMCCLDPPHCRPVALPACCADDVLLFTTDPPNMAARGSIKGGEVYTGGVWVQGCEVWNQSFCTPRRVHVR